MKTIDYKFDAALRCLYFYYCEFVYSNEQYYYTGDKRDKKTEYASVGLISSWLDFSEKEKIHLNRTELVDILTHLENDNLIISKIIETEKVFKITPSGIELLDNNGYVRKTKRTNREYKMKRGSIIISIISLLIPLAIFIYTIFFRKT